MSARQSSPVVRRWVVYASVLLLGLSVPQIAWAAGAQMFTATLTGAQEVPATASPGTGLGTVLLNAAEDQITVNLTFSGLSDVAILGHIHGPAAPGVEAGVLFDFAADVAALAAAGGTIPQRTFTITAAQVAELKAGLYYFNVHTNTNPGGEIRGQIALAATQFTTTLTGGQQVPPVVSGGTGTGMVALNAAEDQMIVNLTFSGLTGNAILGHIHGTAAPNENAGVLFDFAGDVAALAAPGGTIPQRVFAISPSQVADLKAGLYYFNVHTGLNPGGEIRGQITPVIATLDRASLRFAATTTGAAFTQQTPGQTFRILQSGSAFTMAWTATANKPWITVSPTSGTGSAVLTVTVSFDPSVPVSGNATGSIALSFTGSSTQPGPISVGLATVLVGQSASPIGVMDTPVDGTTGVTGSIAVTGWALDDVAIAQVRVMREPVTGEAPGLVFIGNAVLIDGARPDVAAGFPGVPLNTRAGWGYLLLTNFLPNSGNGTVRLHAVAVDVEGHSTDLGTRTITSANSTATRPFGAIDTPGQGETISGGAFGNFGWVLSRAPALAFPPNGTVRVLVDGAFLPGSPVLWTARVDLTSLFPLAAYPGIGNALGIFPLDTTALSNGVHSIAWIVTADNNETDGIGSRFFTVANGAGLAAGVAAGVHPAAGTPLNLAPIVGRRGYDNVPYRTFSVGAGGRATIQAEEMDRIELQLAADPSAAAGDQYAGSLRVGDALAPLPIGSRLNPSTGVFTWQPGPGFLRAYDFLFVRSRAGRAAARQEVRIVINPRGSNRLGPQLTIDIPAANAQVAQPFVVAGWAIDGNAATGTGVDTLHVWAYPLTMCGGAPCHGTPVFLGVAANGGRRPDVAALFGERFRESGFGLTVAALPPGTYDVAVFAWSTATIGFLPAKVVRVTIR
jgi:hypothetical protein